MLTIADGLSQGMILAMIQTGDGFIWLATKDGLNRYDGYGFDVFVNNPFDPYSIEGNESNLLYEDHNANIWINLPHKGLDLLEKKTGKFYHLTRLPGYDGSIEVTSMAETLDGSIWLGTPAGLYRLRWKNPLWATEGLPDAPELNDRFEIQCFQPESSVPGRSHIFQLQAAADGSLYINSGKIYDWKPGYPGPIKRLDSDKPGPMYPSIRGGVMVVLDKSFAWIDPDGQNYLVPKTAPFFAPQFCGMADKKGNILVCGSDNRQFLVSESELFYFGRALQPVQIGALPHFFRIALFDRSGNIWLGSAGYGVYKIPTEQSPFQHLLTGNSIRRITNGPTVMIWSERNLPYGYSMAPDNSGTSSEILDYFFTSIQTADGKEWKLRPAKQGSELVQTATGAVFPFEQSAFQYSPVMQDHEGRIWVGGDKSQVWYFDPATATYTDFDLGGHLGEGVQVYALHEDPQRHVWVGSTQGLVELGETNGTYSVLRHFQTIPSDPTSLLNNFTITFCDDPLRPDQYLWVGTKGGGANRLYKPDGRFLHLTSQNSDLPNDVVYGILSDEAGNLWCSTNRGLSRITLPREADAGPRQFRFRNFRASDGLQHDEFNTTAYAKLPDGRLVFGGINGLTVFQPRQIREQKSQARIWFTDLKINNERVNYREQGSVLSRPVQLTDQIELRFDQNSINIEYALLDFENPAENRYRYRLRGVDPNWVEAGTSHSANYSRLGPGIYTFEVQGSAAGGDWTTSSAAIRIVIYPPWWASPWAYFLYALVAAAAIRSFYRFRISQIALAQQLKFEQMEASRLKEMDNFKGRFFTNISHEFRTPLTVILGMADRLDSLDKSPESGAFGNAVALIRRNGQNLLRLINQILDLSKLEEKNLSVHLIHGDVAAYVRYIAESLHSLANAQNVMLRVESRQASIPMDFDPERLLQIVYNLLSNAIKFTPEGGRVTLELDLPAPDQLLLRVADTGLGIPEQDLPFIFDRFYQARNLEKAKTGGTGIGLALTRELVLLMGGSIGVESEPGHGAVFTVTLPVTHQAPPAGDLSLPALHELPVSATATLAAKQPHAPEDAGLPHVLLLEDNPDVVEYLEACLRGRFRLDFAYNGRAGIEKALQGSPDLIVSDVMMPEKDGLEVCDYLKNDLRSSHIPIVLLTAKADVESRIAGLRRGADAYLAKPFVQAELLAVLDNLLESRRKLHARYATLLASRPERPAPAPELALEDAFMQQLDAVIASRLSDPALSAELAGRAIGMSRSNLYAKLTALTGLSFNLYLRNLRLREAQRLLSEGRMNVSEVAYAVGFNDPRYFSRVFAEAFGMPPSEWSKKSG